MILSPGVYNFHHIVPLGLFIIAGIQVLKKFHADSHDKHSHITVSNIILNRYGYIKQIDLPAPASSSWIVGKNTADSDSFV